MKVLGLAGCLFGIGWLILCFPSAPKHPREPARLCYSNDMFKTDYCSKMGKQWSL